MNEPLLKLDGIPDHISAVTAFKFWYVDKQARGQAMYIIACGGVLLSGASIASIAMLLSGSQVSDLLVPFAFGAFTLGIIFYTFLHQQKAIIRATVFARDNNFRYQSSVPSDRPGLLFDRGHSKAAESHIDGTYLARNFECFNYTFTEGSGKNSHTYNFGVVALTLDRRIPNVLFDSRQNNAWLTSNIASLHNSQKLEVEGDFNTYFDIYVPDGYGRDTLYFLTPELMALMIDNAGSYDMEVVDNILYFYIKELSFKRVELQQLFAVIASVGGEFHENTDRYADERIGNRSLNQIASGGLRLKKGIPWAVIIGAGGVVLIVLIHALFTIGVAWMSAD